MTVGVLFVCTGNICRSPTAEGVFRHMVEAAGLGRDILVDSAGTHGYHIGDPPDERSAATAAKRGYSLHGQAARQVRDNDFERFDYILAMDRGHMRLLDAMAPATAGNRLKMFLSFAEGASTLDVPDPYYGGAGGFEHVLDLVEAGSHGLLAAIRRDHLSER